MPSLMERRLQRDTESIRSKVFKMGRLVERALREALQALREENLEPAYATILRDMYIDDLEVELDALCQRFLIKHVPAAGHMRFIYSVIKINTELERVGDYAESIARHIVTLKPLIALSDYPKLMDIAELAIPLVYNAVQSFAEQDIELARATLAKEKDKTIDNLRDEIHREVIQQHDEGKLPSEALMPLLTIASRFERAADQAGNICEEVIYMTSGEETKHPDKRVLRVLFVDERNACRSQMAEGIGNALGLDRVVFSSAGINPCPVAEQTISFMAQKGIDISEQAAKYVNQVPELNRYDVVILLCKEAERAHLPIRAKVLRIGWELEDPSRVEGSESEREQAFEATFQYLESRIRNFVDSIFRGLEEEVNAP